MGEQREGVTAEEFWKDQLVEFSPIDSSAEAVLRFAGADNRFPVNALFRCNFKWPIIDGRYLAAAIEALDTLAFFDEID